ncbi:TonB-dependent receptor plug domain-containing protein [Algoriphagus pacificus]|uniref:TonB-dependent receptor plug domain-containing protein n=1 Tax=Algoriphagus pacificus TaxID=2811234 RepID=A0ABS3CL83_9BACT|nr:TonB-dependent receptor plug domain-containing protein [Algoriphagus pacificus]MBN7817000.1 TonB-dependent receptor plug domain-containing protein [Algoriphagus pacificus]
MLKKLVKYIWYIQVVQLIALKTFAQTLPTKVNELNLEEVLVLGKTEIDTIKISGTKPRAMDILANLPGIFRIHDNSYPIIYRGMTSNRLRIEKDGATKLGILNQGYFGNDINPDELLEIDLVEGMEKVVYGSGAMGGVIDIQMKPPTLDESHQLYYHFGSNSNSHTLGGRWGVGDSIKGFKIRVRTQTSGNYSYAKKEEAQNSSSSQNNLSLSSFLSKNEGFQIQWNQSFSNGYWERPQGFQNNPNELRSFKDHINYQGNIKVFWGSDLKNQENIWTTFQKSSQFRDSYHLDFSRLNFKEIREYDQLSFGHKYQRPIRINKKLTGKIGTDFLWIRQFESGMLENLLDDVIEFEEKSLAGMQSRTGVFMTGKYRAESKLNLDFGIRADLNSLGKSKVQWRGIVTGATSLNWKISDHVKSVWTLGRYFRWPTFQESSGEFFGGRGIFLGNENILPEKSYQLDWIFEGRIGRLQFKWNSWLAFQLDRITEIPMEIGYYSYENTEKARSMGFETQLDYLIWNRNNQYSIYLIHGFQIMSGMDISEAGFFKGGTPLFGIPPGKSSAKVVYSQILNSKISIHSEIQHEFVLAFDQLPEGTIRQTWAIRPSEAYHLLNAKIEAQITNKKNFMNLGMEVKNMTDEYYVPFGINVPGIGRDFQIYFGYNW